MDIEKIKKANTKSLGKQIEYYQEISSTHIYAKQIAGKNDNNGKLIIAEAQTAGIGTNGRAWYTGAGKNIAATIIVKPDCSIRALEGLTMKIAEGIKEAIYGLYKIELTIKKPNDLLSNGKKVCGILTEINTIGEKINYLIISFGINVNEDEFSKEITKKATSLKEIRNQTCSREDILIKILEAIEKESNEINA